MANNESLGQFIDPAAWSDFERLKKVVADASDSMEYLSMVAKDAFAGLGNVATLKDVIDLTNKSAVANNAMTESLTKVKSGVKLLTEEQIKNNMSIKEANDYLKLKVAFDTADINTIAGKRAEIRLLTAEYNKLDLEQQKVVATQKRAELDSKNASLKSNVDAYTAQKINIGNYPEMMSQAQALKGEMDALAATGQKDSAEFTNLATKLNETQAAMGGLTGEAKVIITSMQQMAALGQEDSAEFERLAERLVEVRAQLNMVSMAVEEAGAKSERGAVAMEKLGESLKEIGKFAIAFFGIQAGMEFISGITEEFGKADEAARKLKNTLENVGSANLFGELTKQATEFAEKFNYLDTYEVQNVFSKLITYGKLTEDQINETLPVIIDFAAKTGHSLDESAEVIIKALEGSSKGLKDFGINIKEAKTATGEAMPQAERFGFIMEQLKPRVKGAADAFQGGFSGSIAGFKKDLREAELAIADFFVKISGVEEANYKLAVSNTKEATEGKKLVAEYEDISKKAVQTTGDKKRLDDITQQLAITFGDSVVSIDKETNALKLNLKATQDLIDKKTLLSNQAINDAVMAYRKAESDRKAAYELDAVNGKLYENAQKKTGENTEDLERRMSATSKGGRIINTLTPDEADQVALKGRVQAGREIIESAIAARAQAMEKLRGLVSQEDADKLLAAPVDKLDPSKNNPKVPGGEKPDKDYKIQNEKAITDALYEQYAMQEKAKAIQQKEIVDDEMEAYQKRKEALMEYNRFEANANQVKILNQYEQKSYEVSNMTQKPKESNDSFAERKKIANQQLLNLEQEYNAQVLADKKKLKEDLEKLDDDTIQHNLSIAKDIEEVSENHKAVELNNEKIRYEKGLIDFDKYNKDKEEIEKKYTLASLLLKKAYYEQLIKDTKGGDPDTKKYQSALDQTNNSIAGIGATEKKGSSNPALSAIGLSDDDWKNAQKIGNEMINLQGELMKAVDQRYQAEIAALERKQQLIDANYDAEINSINGSFQSEQKKAQAIAVLTAQKAAQDKQIHNEEVALKRKMAAADKTASIASAIEKGVVAVIGALDTEPVWLGIALAAVVGATVAAQIANIASAPMPQYGEGTEDHPGGLALVGELNKPEWIFEPGRNPYMVNTATKLNLAKHTRVVPEADLLNESAGMLPEAMLHNFDATAMMAEMVADKMDGVRGEVANLTSAVINKTETRFTFDQYGARKFQKKGNQWTEYINSNFN